MNLSAGDTEPVEGALWELASPILRSWASARVYGVPTLLLGVEGFRYLEVLLISEERGKWEIDGLDPQMQWCGHCIDLMCEWNINLPHQWSALGSDQKDGTVDKSKRKQLSLKGSWLRGIVRRSVIQVGLRVERFLHTDRWFIHPTRMAPGCLL